MALGNCIVKREIAKAWLICLCTASILQFFVRAKSVFRNLFLGVVEECPKPLAGVKLVATSAPQRQVFTFELMSLFVWWWPGHMICISLCSLTNDLPSCNHGFGQQLFGCWIEVIEVITKGLITSITSYAKVRKTLLLFLLFF